MSPIFGLSLVTRCPGTDDTKNRETGTVEGERGRRKEGIGVVGETTGSEDVRTRTESLKRVHVYEYTEGGAEVKK